MGYAPPTCKQVKSMLLRLGFVATAGKGSHENYRHEFFKGSFRKVTVDCPKAPFSDVLVSSMARQAGLTRKQFLQACHDDRYAP